MENNIQVMLIDDDEDDRMLFAMALKWVSPLFQCSSLSNCPEALLLLESGFRADMIFLDLNMPQMHGFECLRRIRQSAEFGTVPVIIYSTSGNCAEIEKAQESGANGYLKKPSDIDQLSLKLKAVIARVMSAECEFFIG